MEEDMVLAGEVWKDLLMMRGGVDVALEKVLGKASRRARGSLLMKALAAMGMLRAGRRESSVRRAAEENVVAAPYEWSG